MKNEEQFLKDLEIIIDKSFEKAFEPLKKSVNSLSKETSELSSMIKNNNEIVDRISTNDLLKEILETKKDTNSRLKRMDGSLDRRTDHLQTT
jgi:hypothetical protein